MTLTLVLESAPRQQQVQSHVHHGGDLTIGRGDDADWHIDDPDKFISRRHCVISGQDDVFSITDSSSGGLFLDGASTPLGAGNSASLEHGMRLRMGDFVLRVELDNDASANDNTPQVNKPSTGIGFEADDFFAVKSAPVKQPDRPDSLPDPFERVQQGNSFDLGDSQEDAPPQFDDSFTLDPVATPDDTPEPAPPPEPEPPVEQAKVVPVQKPVPPVDTPPPTTDQSDLIAALFDGLGLSDDKLFKTIQAEEMRAIGKNFRLLVDGVMHLLRTRAKEKQNVRVAQTIIGAQDVNPLKFLATTDDALEALIKPRGKGYLPPEAAIEGVFRDLTDHQMRTWAALQTALRRMIDNFDPDAIEKEMENTGLLEAMMAGGKSAKLWQLYEERYQEIAKSAEERFLGEVGADFRDAYEQYRRN